jgi:signal transduction histidine kinase
MTNVVVVVDAATGAAIAAVGLLAWPRHRVAAVVALLTATAWFVGSLAPSLVLAHRTLLLATVLSLAPGGVRRRDGQVALFVCAATLFLPASMMPWATIATGLLCVAVASRLLGPGSEPAAPMTIAVSRSLLVLGTGLLLPALERMVWQYSMAALPLLTYLAAVLLSCVLLAGGLREEGDHEADGVIALSQLTPMEALAQLKRLAADDPGPRRSQALARAATLLEENLRLQDALAAHIREVRASRARLLEAAEVERRRLERVLAEGPGARLSEIEHCLRSTAAHVSGQPAASDCLAEIMRTRDDLNQIARGLHPRLLTDSGLGAALEELSLRSPVPLEVTAPDRRFPEPAEQALWYACAEAVSNVWKHSAAGRVRVDLCEVDGAVHATIEDDGVGGAELVPAGGLAGLRDRLADVGGRLQVRSTADGTVVDVTVPVP